MSNPNVSPELAAALAEESRFDAQPDPGQGPLPIASESATPEANLSTMLGLGPTPEPPVLVTLSGARYAIVPVPAIHLPAATKLFVASHPVLIAAAISDPGQDGGTVDRADFALRLAELGVLPEGGGALIDPDLVLYQCFTSLTAEVLKQSLDLLYLAIQRGVKMRETLSGLGDLTSVVPARADFDEDLDIPAIIVGMRHFFRVNVGLSKRFF